MALPMDHPFLSSFSHAVNQPSPAPLLVPRAQSSPRSRSIGDSIPPSHSGSSTKTHLKPLGSTAHMGRWDIEAECKGVAPLSHWNPGEFGDQRSSRMSVVSGPRNTKYGDLSWKGSGVSVDSQPSNGDEQTFDSAKEGLPPSPCKTGLRFKEPEGWDSQPFKHSIRGDHERTDDASASCRLNDQPKSRSASTVNSPCTPTPDINVEQDPFAVRLPRRKTSRYLNKKKCDWHPRERLPLLESRPESVTAQAVAPVAVGSTVNVTPRKTFIPSSAPSGSPPGFFGSTDPPFPLVSLEEAREREAEKTRMDIPRSFKMSLSPNAVRSAVSSPEHHSDSADDQPVQNDSPTVAGLNSSLTRSGAPQSTGPGLLRSRKSRFNLFKNDHLSSTLSLPFVPSISDGQDGQRTPNPVPGRRLSPSALSTQSPWAGSDDLFWDKDGPEAEASNSPGAKLRPLELLPVSVDISREIPQEFLVNHPRPFTCSPHKLRAKHHQTPRKTAIPDATVSTPHLGDRTSAAPPIIATEEDRIAKLEAQVDQLLGLLSSSSVSSLSSGSPNQERDWYSSQGIHTYAWTT